jgi:hypothetical protein
MIGDGKAFLFGQPIFQATDNLAGRLNAKAIAYRRTSPVVFAYENI